MLSRELRSVLDQCFSAVNGQSLDAIMQSQAGADVNAQNRYMDCLLYTSIVSGSGTPAGWSSDCVMSRAGWSSIAGTSAAPASGAGSVMLSLIHI